MCECENDSEVRIMGSFDHWTKGVSMSPEFMEGGNNVFVADMKLLKGTYEIKFVVDGIWQTAGGLGDVHRVFFFFRTSSVPHHTSFAPHASSRLLALMCCFVLSPHHGLILESKRNELGMNWE